MKYTVAYPVSPFVSGQVAGRIINKQMDLIKGNKKPVAEAMKTITIQINAEIQKTLEREPEMKRIYEGLVEKAR